MVRGLFNGKDVKIEIWLKIKKLSEFG